MPTKADAKQAITIEPYNEEVLTFSIVGTSPYVQHRFPEKAKHAMKAKMVAGSTAAKGKKRPPRDFDADYEAAQHFSTEGWRGIPAAAFRNAMIDACRMAGFQMTRAKMSIFVEADGFDREDMTPLVRIEGEPEQLEHIVRMQQTTDIRVRPGWAEWTCTLHIAYDADQFTAEDVANLLTRAGRQVGIGEGRPFSKSSNGMGWGTFRPVYTDEQEEAA
jgi:hypothetical protein